MSQASYPKTAINLRGYYAGFISRLIAFIIDMILISVVVMFSSWLISTTLEMLQIKPLLNAISHNLLGSSYIDVLLDRPIIASILTLLLVICYFVFFWYTVGQTPGKAFMGIRIVTTEGEKLSLWKVFLRYLGYILSGMFLGFGFLWILVDDKRMGWHDKIAKTCVIYTWDACPDERFLVKATQDLSARKDSIRNFVSNQSDKDKN